MDPRRQLAAPVLTFALAAALAAPAPTLAAPSSRAGLRPRARATARRPAARRSQQRIGLRHMIRSVREELHVYRGDRIERWSNRLALGRSDFNRKLSVAKNLEALVSQHKLPHYYASVNGRQVLHVVVDLAHGRQTKKTLRRVLKRIGADTIELNFKAPTQKNRWGHVAVRVGSGATFDLTGTRGVARLPRLAERLLKLVRGKSSLSFARRRNLRRFMEGRRESNSASVYFGMLFQATPQEIAQTARTYRQRQGEIKEFSVSGGDAAQGVYSCAQFLTEAVPFLNQRGIGRNVGAKSTAAAARRSDKLQAVVVYKMPRVNESQLKAFAD